MNTRSDAIERRARELYRQSCHHVAPADRQALRQARLDALATRPTPLMQRLLMPVGALAASALALVVAWSYFPAQEQSGQNTPTGTAYTEKTLPAKSDLDMYQDLDFYRWLAVRTDQPKAKN